MLRSINRGFGWAKVRPFFDASQFPFSERPDGEFVFCRISRDDADKFSVDTMRIFDMIQAPAKRGIILGISDRVYQKIGPAPAHVECLAPGARQVADVLAGSHVLIQSCDTYENLPRVGMEAMASGTVVIADKRGGWLELIDSKTGALCESTFEFVYSATVLAQQPEIRRKLALAARQRVLDLYGFEASAKDWVTFFNQLEACHPV